MLDILCVSLFCSFLGTAPGAAKAFHRSPLKLTIFHTLNVAVTIPFLVWTDGAEVCSSVFFSLYAAAGIKHQKDRKKRNLDSGKTSFMLVQIFLKNKAVSVFNGQRESRHCDIFLLDSLDLLLSKNNLLTVMRSA